MDRINVLYVDDEPLNLMLFSEIFEDDFIIYTENSGGEGLQTLSEKSNIQVVISDMRMPDMDGVEFISKAKENHPDISFFIITGYGLTPEITKAITDGIVKNHLNKPFDIYEIKEAIEQAVL